MQTFKNKVVWITGASSGYGAAVAKAFAQAGAQLILSARRHDKLQALAQELGNAVALPLDLADFGSFQAKTQEAIAAFGHIDIIMHNGALAQNAAIMETKLTVERKIMEVDYFSYTELNRCVLPYMLERKSGHVVVVSGLLAHIPAPRRATYAAAKAALIAYFDSLRAELLGKNIDVTILIPGAMQTGLVGKALQPDGQVDPGKADFVSPMGIALDDAAHQTLQLIAEKKKQAYVGLEDEYKKLWELLRTDPERGIDLFMEKMKNA